MERPPIFRTEIISTLKISILPKLIYTFNAIFIKMPMTLFTEVGKTVPKFTWKHEKSLMSKQS
jgi:hypothetical protein